MSQWLTSEEAAQRLGVKRSTLYTYVSRGLIGRHREGVESLFARDDVDALVRGRRHPGAPADLLGMRSIWSAVSEVREGELFLRGVALADLADEPFDEVVDLLLGEGSPDVVALPAGLESVPLARRLPLLALHAGAQRRPLDRESAVGAARGLLAAASSASGGGPGPLPAELFAGLADRRGSVAEVATLNAVLVALVDHGLAASVVAARVAASARAGAYDCLLAGYAALSGRLHGGIGPGALATLRGADGSIGFGHWRHPLGDPRAEVILARLQRVEGAAGVLAEVERIAARLGKPANVDGALAALTLACDLPDDAPELLFQVGRTVGMAAHVVEELDEDPLRWRARDASTEARPG